MSNSPATPVPGPPSDAAPGGAGALPERIRRWGPCQSYAAILLAVAVCSRGIAERWWLTTLLLYIPQLIYGLPLPLLALTAWRRRDRHGGIAVVAGCLLVAGPMMGWENPQLQAGPVRGAPRVRVLAYNVELLAAGPAPLVRQLHTAQADVVVLEEAGRSAPRVGNLVRRTFPEWSVTEAGDITVASRWPISAETAIPLGPARVAGARNQRRALAVTVAAPFASFAVLGVHFHTALDGGSFRRHWRRLPAYVEGSAAVRREQAADVAAWVRRARLPAIIAGDFNTPPAGLAYGVLRGAGLRDAFEERGWGWGYTFPARQPLLRIDYVFHTAAWDALHCRVGATDGSDHRPVLAELALRDPVVDHRRQNGGG